jgi:FAR1 DNA-binding domain
MTTPCLLFGNWPQILFPKRSSDTTTSCDFLPPLSLQERIERRKKQAIGAPQIVFRSIYKLIQKTKKFGNTGKSLLSPSLSPFKTFQGFVSPNLGFVVVFTKAPISLYRSDWVMAEVNPFLHERVGNANEEETNQGKLEKIRGQVQAQEGEKSGTSLTEEEPELANEKPSKNDSGTDVSAALPAPPQTLYKEYATRVAQVMRTYLSGGAVGQTACSSHDTSGNAGGECCKAMMEVVRKKHGKWVVTKLDNEHNHATEQNLGEENSNFQKLGDDNIAIVPTIGMEFESVEAAKVFYSEYGEKTGFKTRTGSNRRSANSGALTMQRFVCYKGDYKTGTGSNAGRMRRLYRKKLTENDEDGPVAKRTRGSRSKAEVIELESSGEDEETESDEGRAGKGKKGKKGKKKKKIAGSGSGAGGSLLYRLIRVPHHNNEERRRILLKYLNKRRNRGVLGRPGKVNM